EVKGVRGLAGGRRRDRQSALAQQHNQAALAFQDKIGYGTMEKRDRESQHQSRELDQHCLHAKQGHGSSQSGKQLIPCGFGPSRAHGSNGRDESEATTEAPENGGISWPGRQQRRPAKKFLRSLVLLW